MSSAFRHCAVPIAASLGLHGLLALVAAVWLMLPQWSFLPRMPMEAAQPEPEAQELPDLAEVEVTFVTPEELLKLPTAKPLSPEAKPKPAEKAPGSVHVVASEDMPALAPFESATSFISDRNLRAASTSAPIPGANPLIPNQDGAELPGLSLFNANPTSGSQKPQPRPSPPSVVQPPPTPQPEPQPDDRPPESIAKVSTADPNAPAPPREEPKTPSMRERPPDPLAMTEINPRTESKSKDKPPQDPDPQSTKGQAAGPRPVVSSVKTKVAGGIAIRGPESSVDAKDTPEGRFLSAMHDRIGLLWNSRLAMNRGIAGSGSVEVEFDIDINSRISNVRLVDPGKANPILEDICLTSVIKARLPPLPPSMKREVQDPLNGGKIRRKVTFHRL
jgi:outer membrane biosynthesis protein TonB